MIELTSTRQLAVRYGCRGALRAEVHPTYSSVLASQVSAARAKRLFSSLAQALAAARDLARGQSQFGAGQAVVAGPVKEPSVWWSGPRDRLSANTHRPVTNDPPDRRNDFRGVSRGATRFGRLTNHSDVDDHVSTIGLSRGQGQRVPFHVGYLWFPGDANP